jgi:hypothetical protein
MKTLCKLGGIATLILAVNVGCTTGPSDPNAGSAPPAASSATNANEVVVKALETKIPASQETREKTGIATWYVWAEGRRARIAGRDAAGRLLRGLEMQPGTSGQVTLKEASGHVTTFDASSKIVSQSGPSRSAEEVAFALQATNALRADFSSSRDAHATAYDECSDAQSRVDELVAELAVDLALEAALCGACPETVVTCVECIVAVGHSALAAAALSSAIAARDQACTGGDLTRFCSCDVTMNICTDQNGIYCYPNCCDDVPPGGGPGPTCDPYDLYCIGTGS